MDPRFLDNFCIEDITLKQFLFLMCFFGVGGRGGSKSCPSPTDIGLRVPTRNLRNIPLFRVSTSSKHCPHLAVPLRQTVCTNLYSLKRQIITVIQIL